jgi:carboxyl-terminal processing protease
MIERRLSLVAALTIVVTGVLLGGAFGDRVQADSRPVEDRFWTFGRVLALVEDQYAGKVDQTELVEGAIEGMLRSLDPHSNYLDPESFTEMRDEQRGRFHGLGIQITKRGPDKPLTIIAPIDDTPASRAGLRCGDIISHIEGEPTIDLTVQDAVRQLKGEKGTTVTITIQRPGRDDSFDVTLERAEIPIESVRVAYMVRPDVGIVRITNFNTTTAEELDAAVTHLRSLGMTRLILDLRSNPGGLLDQAVQVSERFLDPGKLVVYTRGRIAGSNQDFRSKRAEERIDVPLIVLVDRSSASASEIVSGAVQDHDRGIVIGETTFGKGLVQRVIPLGDGGALAVTTAKYYTPAGRLIQRDYTDLDDYYLNRPEVEAGVLERPLEPADPAETGELAEREIFYTASGRRVYGGGGITPDYIVPTAEIPELILKLERDNLLFDYAVDYARSHPDLVREFTIEPETLADFRRYVRDRKFEMTDEEFAEHRDAIVRQLRARIARVRWDQSAEALILAEGDPQIQRALELFGEAERLAASAVGHEPGPDFRAEVERPEPQGRAETMGIEEPETP